MLCFIKISDYLLNLVLTFGWLIQDRSRSRLVTSLNILRTLGKLDMSCKGRGDPLLEFTSISNSLSLQSDFGCTSTLTSRRFEFGFTPTSFRCHFGFTFDGMSTSRRCLFDSFRCHFELTSRSLQCHLDFELFSSGLHNDVYFITP